MQCNKDLSIPIGVSARHIHLTQEDVEKLFGSGYRLTKQRELMGGQYAAEETVTLQGPSERTIEEVRVLGPVRPRSQVEISVTDGIRLGINAPLRDSGDLKGSAPIAVIGPKGSVHFPEGCIVAARHIHMSPRDAEEMGVKDGDSVLARAGEARKVIFCDVKVRVDKQYTLEMHIDTDEANAAGVATGDAAVILNTTV